MADKKAKDETQVAYAGITSKHIIRMSSDDASGNVMIYADALRAGIIAAALPTQTSNSGKFLTTNGTAASWAAPAATAVSNDSGVAGATVAAALDTLASAVTTVASAVTNRWTTTGNSGTTAGTNFIGTTDNVAFVVKVNSLQVMKFHPATSGYRIEAGDSALTNLIIGNGAGAAWTSTIEHSTFIGHNSGNATVDGKWNTFIGDVSGLLNVSGNRNTYVGHAAGMNAKGSYNVAVGVNSLELEATVVFDACVGVGDSAGRNNKGSYNTFVGESAGTNNLAGSEGVWIGSGSGPVNTTGSQNFFGGRGAGFLNTTGSRNFYGSYYAGTSFNTSSSDNNIIGVSFCDAGTAVRNNWNGMGNYAGGNLTGDNMILFGYRAGNSFKINAAVAGTNSIYFHGFSSSAREIVFGGPTYSTGTVYYDNMYLNGRFGQVADMHGITIQPISVVDTSFSTSSFALSQFGAAVTNGSAAASTLTFAGAQGTGTGPGGDILFKTANAGASGASNNALAEVLRITYDKKIQATGIVITAASTTTQAGFRIPSGTAPSSPTSGDFWYDGTNLKFRDGGTTRTLTWT